MAGSGLGRLRKVPRADLIRVRTGSRLEAPISVARAVPRRRREGGISVGRSGGRDRSVPPSENGGMACAARRRDPGHEKPTRSVFYRTCPVNLGLQVRSALLGPCSAQRCAGCVYSFAPLRALPV